MSAEVELRALLERATKGPWEIRPIEFDDWGWIRGASVPSQYGGEYRPVVCIAKEGGYQTDEDLAVHRRDGTDPTQHNADLIVAMHTHLPALLDRLERAEKALAKCRVVIEEDRDNTFSCFKNMSGPREGSVTDRDGKRYIRAYDDALAAIDAALKASL